MAPKRRATETRKPDPSFSPRRTRSSTVGAPVASKPVELPPQRKRKVSKANDTVPEDLPEPRKSSRTQKNSQEEYKPAGSEAVVSKQKPPKENATEAVDTPQEADEKTRARKKIQLEKQPAASGTIIIEHCKQCQIFRRRTEEIKKGLEDALPDVVVQVNPEKPRRGCFEIRDESGQTFVSLLGMPRPFQKLRDLDMDVVIACIIEKLKQPSDIV